MARMRTTIAALVLGAGLTASAGAADVVPLATEGRTFNAWAIDPATGAIYGTLPEAGRAVEFDPETGAERRTFPCKVQEHGVVLTVKGGRLLVGHAWQPTLLGIDLGTGQRAFEVQLPEKLSSPLLVASARAEPWVWLTAGGDRTPPSLVKVDVATGEVVSSSTLEGHMSGLKAAAVSPDGQLLVMKDTFSALLFAIDAATGDAWCVRSLRDVDQAMEVRAGPHGRTWSIGRSQVSADLSTVISTSQERRLLHPRRDLDMTLVRSERGFAIRLRRASSGEEVAAIPVTVESEHRTELQVDAERERLLCTHERGAMVVSLADVPAPATLALVATPSLAVVRPGEQVVVRVAAPAGGDAVNLALIEPPAGATLSRDTITWTPAPEQVGLQRLRVSGRRGEEQAELTVLVDVRVASVALDFPVGRLAIDPQGRRVLACSQAGPSGAEKKRAPGLAVVDLARGTVSGRRELDRDPTTIVLTSESAFVVQRLPDVMFRARASDLADDAKGFHPGLTDLVALGSRLVGTFSGAGASGTVALDAASFDELWRVPLPMGGDPGRLAPTPTGGAKTPNAWVRPDGELRDLIGPLDYMPAVRTTPSRVIAAPQVSQRQAARHASLPVAFTATRRWVDQAYVVELEVRDLVADEVVMKLPVGRVRRTGMPPDQFQWAPPIATAGDKVVVACHDTLYVLPLPVDTLSKLARPLEVEPSFETTPVLRHDGAATTLGLTAHGGAGTVRWALDGPLAGVTLDEASGAVTIDPATAWREFVAGITAPVQWQMDRARVHQDLLGADAASCPLFVRIGVVARDARQQQVRCDVVAVVLGPRSDVQKALDAVAAQVAAARQGAAQSGHVDAAAIEALRRELAAVRAEVARVQAVERRAVEPPASAGRDVGALRLELDALRGGVDALRRELEAVRADRGAARGDDATRQPASVSQPSPAVVVVVVVALAAVAFVLGRATGRRGPSA